MSLDEATPKYCGFLRRVAAVFYDTVLLLSVFFLATLLLMPFLGETAIESGNLFYNIYLALLVYLYFCWQWKHGGQTLGMRAWRIRLRRTDSDPINWKQSTARFILAVFSWVVFGLGFIWSLIDKNKMTFHDRVSRTILIVERR